MIKVEIYTRPLCGFCSQAKKILDGKGTTYTEYDIWAEAGRKDEMIQRANGCNTVPQIFINERHVGGCDELIALEKQGGLDRLLEESP